MIPFQIEIHVKPQLVSKSDLDLMKWCRDFENEFEASRIVGSAPSVIDAVAGNSRTDVFDPGFR